MFFDPANRQAMCVSAYGRGGNDVKPSYRQGLPERRVFFLNLTALDAGV
ncbi:MAG: hypothetical protein PSV18_06010 [Methylobacter sp.]|jgi:hypothetical protein|nr:hypothetical protein [Candidatus Methylobacter titanis]